MAVKFSKMAFDANGGGISVDVPLAKTTATTNKIRKGSLVTIAGAKGFSHSTAASSVKPTHLVDGYGFSGIAPLIKVTTGDIKDGNARRSANLDDGNPLLDYDNHVLKMFDLTQGQYRSEVVTTAPAATADINNVTFATSFATIGGSSPTYATLAAARTALLGKYLQLVNLSPDATEFGRPYVTNSGASATATAAAFCLVSEVVSQFDAAANRNIAVVTFKFV